MGFLHRSLDTGIGGLSGDGWTDGRRVREMSKSLGIELYLTLFRFTFSLEAERRKEEEIKNEIKISTL